jgi:hypothetical protein
MSMYHTSELCLLATVYRRLLINYQPLQLWFAPEPTGWAADRILRVQPDALPAGRAHLAQVSIDGKPFDCFDPHAMTIKLPRSDHQLEVVATLQPTDSGDRR